MGRPAGINQPARLGCKYADLYYAGQFNITEKEARNSYACALSREDDKVAFSCPFDFLKDCLAEDTPTQFADGIVAGMLQSKSNTCKLLPISYSSSCTQPDYIHYECSNCKTTIKGSVEFMSYCYSCGARLV